MKNNLQNKWLVILNPHAGARKGLRDMEEIIGLLGDYNMEHLLAISEYGGHIIELSKKYVLEGYRNILVAGGDGSLNEVVNGIFLQDKVAISDITIGMLPVGTGNDWIRTFGIPDDYNKALEIVQQRKTVFQDVGRIVYKNKKGEKQRFFVNMAGFGFDAVVAAKVNSLKDKGWSGKKLYLWALLYSYLKYNTKRMKIVVNGHTFDDLIFTASIGIGKYNGGGMMQSPYAVPTNGQFNITLIRKINLWGLITNISGLYSGKYVKDYRVSAAVGKEIQISSKRKIPGEADGEHLGNANYKIEIIPNKLRVIYGDDSFLNTIKDE